jgi:glutamine amidotransferase
MKSIAVIDYGMGNLHSVAKALEHVDANIRVWVTRDAHKINACDRVLLPGVGGIRDCVGDMRRLGIDEIVTNVINTKPMLAICVGMQALMQYSTENGGVACLDLLPGQAYCFGDEQAVSNARLKVPHMGWNQVKQIPHPLWQGIDNQSRFYFVHSYFVYTEITSLVTAVCHYGVDFHAALAQENLLLYSFTRKKVTHPGYNCCKIFYNGTVVEACR